MYKKIDIFINADKEFCVRMEAFKKCGYGKTLDEAMDDLHDTLRNLLDVFNDPDNHVYDPSVSDDVRQYLAKN